MSTPEIPYKEIIACQWHSMHMYVCITMLRDAILDHTSHCMSLILCIQLNSCGFILKLLMQICRNFSVTTVVVENLCKSSLITLFCTIWDNEINSCISMIITFMCYEKIDKNPKNIYCMVHCLKVYCLVFLTRMSL